LPSGFVNPKPRRQHNLRRVIYSTVFPGRDGLRFPPSLPRDVVEAHRVWLSTPHLCGLTTHNARSFFTSLLCGMRCKKHATFADPRPTKLKLKLFTTCTGPSRLLSMGPPNYAMQETHKSGQDREPLESNMSKGCILGVFTPPPLPGSVTCVRVVAVS
jgi:hypothetical protein